YFSKVENRRVTEQADALRIAGRVDRVYLDTEATCELHDPGLRRRIVVEKTGSRSTVVWNIGGDDVSTIPDMGPDDWPRYVCIESANALDTALPLPPAATHTLTQTLRVAPL